MKEASGAPSVFSALALEGSIFFVLIREAFQEGPVVLKHLVWVCV